MVLVPSAKYKQYLKEGWRAHRTEEAFEAT